ncbi:MAG: hypothetical protein E7331_06270 [Clostridiales bacterium]|nr:hypothetical protein [Clostridiales bacterium]
MKDSDWFVPAGLLLFAALLLSCLVCGPEAEPPAQPSIPEKIQFASLQAPCSEPGGVPGGDCIPDFRLRVQRQLEEEKEPLPSVTGDSNGRVLWGSAYLKCAYMLFRQSVAAG